MATLECPFCYEILDLNPPDKLHSAFSFEKPLENSYHETIIRRRYTCEKCKQSFTIYWYAPLEYFNRI